MQQVAILFARHDSVYKSMPGCDVWDEQRNALLWPGGCPAVAHPPCPQWSRLWALANSDDHQRLLAFFALNAVRQHGGVLEHPYLSLLWRAAGLPKIGELDEYGGYTIALHQYWFGYPAAKPTYLYIVGCRDEQLPAVPFRMGKPEYTCGTSKGRPGTREISHSERTRTYPTFAAWLVEVARRCAPPL